jgi:hypothetical protein
VVEPPDPRSDPVGNEDVDGVVAASKEQKDNAGDGGA